MTGSSWNESFGCLPCVGATWCMGLQMSFHYSLISPPPTTIHSPSIRGDAVFHLTWLCYIKGHLLFLSKRQPFSIIVDKVSWGKQSGEIQEFIREPWPRGSSYWVNRAWTCPPALASVNEPSAGNNTDRKYNLPAHKCAGCSLCSWLTKLRCGSKTHYSPWL